MDLKLHPRRFSAKELSSIRWRSADARASRSRNHVRLMRSGVEVMVLRSMRCSRYSYRSPRTALRQLVFSVHDT